jgi:hypothetical protein
LHPSLTELPEPLVLEGGWRAYELGPVAWAEPLDEALTPVAGPEWHDKVVAWFLAGGDGNLVLAPTGLEPAPETARVVGEEHSERLDHWRFTVEADRPVPVLLKVSCNDGWRATDGNGQQLPEFCVSPYLLGIRAQGAVEVRYRPTLRHRLGAFASCAGGVALLGEALCRRLTPPWRRRGRVLVALLAVVAALGGFLTGLQVLPGPLLPPVG